MFRVFRVSGLGLNRCAVSAFLFRGLGIAQDQGLAPLGPGVPQTKHQQTFILNPKSSCCQNYISAPMPAGSVFRLSDPFVALRSQGSMYQIGYTLFPMYLYREYFKAKVYTIWVRDP